MNHVTRNNIAVARILVVDDEEPLRGIVVSMLVTAGFECREAANGLDALRLLRNAAQDRTFSRAVSEYGLAADRR
jgi:CheY-like chemotaxis protein